MKILYRMIYIIIFPLVLAIIAILVIVAAPVDTARYILFGKMNHYSDAYMEKWPKIMDDLFDKLKVLGNKDD